MTSVAVISSAVASIQRLKLQNKTEKLPTETDDLLTDLQNIQKLLVAAYGRQTEAAGDSFKEVEKLVVRLSYEIVDAIADGLFKPKEMFPVGMLRRKSGTRNPGELKKELSHLLDTILGLQPKDYKTARSGMGEIAPKPKENTPADSKIQEEDVRLDPIRKDLLNPLSDSSEVYMVGEAGIGKSSLARRLFHDPHVRKRFDKFGWVPINQNFQIKEVLQVILQQLGQPDTRETNVIQLIAHIFDQLKDKKYLIVLDNIRSKDDWESIRLALPLAKSSAVIITTSSDKFDKEGRFHKIPCLTEPQILSLLEKHADFNPTDSKEVGKVISDLSGGSPLYAIILGKSLQLEVATGGREKELVKELNYYMPQKGTPQVLEASYKRLAPELKPCLLYMGQFPPCQDIEFDKLYLLLVAENLLSPKENSTPQTLKDHLVQLARLKFVDVQEDIMSTSGLYKSCRLHKLVREFCNLKGVEEEFFEVVETKSSKKAGVEESKSSKEAGAGVESSKSSKKAGMGEKVFVGVGAHTRRLAIYLSKGNADNSIQFDSRDTAKKILSLLMFDTFDESAEEKSEIQDLTEFNHLRILNFDGVNFEARRLPKGVDKLVLLRYLSFRGCRLEELPSSMSHLTQLETLDLLVQADCKMLIPNSIFTNMKKMVHLYLPRLYHIKEKSSELQLQGMEEIETLVNFDTEICDVAALSQLKKLTIFSAICMGHSKDLDVVIDSIGCRLQHLSVDIKSFDCYTRDGVTALKKLLQCQFVHSIRVEGQIVELPKQDSYAEKVVEIVLDGSQLKKDPMSYLGKFQNLRSLVLSNDAFLGDEIVISSAQPFRNLRSLKLEKLQYLEKIRIEKGAMPELSTLQIVRCDCLEKLSIPEKLCDRLKQKNGGDAQWAMALPSKVKINITP